MLAHVLAAALLIRNVTVIDPASASVRRGIDVLIDGTTISAIAPNLAAPDAKVIDGSGKFLIPGLIDMHVHLMLHGWNAAGAIPARWRRDTTEHMLSGLLAYGITTVRDPGAETEAAVTLRNMVNRGDVRGPTVITCGRMINDGSLDAEPMQQVRSVAQVREEIRWQKAAGVDCVKVYAAMSPEFVAAAIDEAHKLGLPVVGHLQRTTWTEGARLGVDTLEHAAPWSEEYVQAQFHASYDGTIRGRIFWLEHLDAHAVDEMVRTIAEHHVVVDPTLIAMATKFLGDEPRWTNNPDLAAATNEQRTGFAAGSFTRDWTMADFRRGHAVWPKLLALTKQLFDAHVTLVAGTDAPTPWVVAGPSLHDELLLLHDAGIAPMDVLRIATTNAATTLHRTDIGRIAVGARADLVLLRANPLDDLRNTRAIDVVIKGGATQP